MKSLNLNSLHHAYLVVGNKDEAERSLHAFFEAAGQKLIGSPDFFHWKEETFGVDDARELSARALRRAFTSRLPSGQAGKKVFFLAPESITIQAQNALLKTFEEPIADTHFFLVVRGEELIIPTLRSRCQVLRVRHSVSNKSEAEEFLKLPLKKRLDFAKKFVEKELNISAFLDDLLSYLRTSGTSADGGQTSVSIEKVYKMRLLSDAPSASSRLVLEHLALIL